MCRDCSPSLIWKRTQLGERLPFGDAYWEWEQEQKRKMTSKVDTIETRTCDRCGAQEKHDLNDHSYKRNRWAKLDVQYQTGDAVLTSKGGNFYKVDVCHVCTRSLVGWWTDGRITRIVQIDATCRSGEPEPAGTPEDPIVGRKPPSDDCPFE